MKPISKILSILIAVFFVSVAYSQPGSEVDLEKQKPKKYEERKLKSEKTGEKKFTAPRRFIQNSVTRYNYYFNAKRKLDEVITNAKNSFKDDYTKLLPFYNYTFEGTLASKNDIDSAIYKCTAGILLHDLRNDWIDNLYILLGKAYMYRKDFDSAQQSFQYINYAFAPKEDGGYDIPLGSNASNTNGIFTIATKEKTNFLKTMVGKLPPSRNESFLWIARINIEQNQMSEAIGLLEILRSDPNFPKRLKTELHETMAYWFYNNQNYDSAAFHLSKALDEADGRSEKARWEFLIAQMYAISNKNEDAIKYFDKAVKHTSDPIMDVYARLYAIRINNSGKKESYLQDNLKDLVKMANRDKYESYRDIIYYTAAQLELERKNYEGAEKWLAKSIKYNMDNPGQKAKSFLLLADLNYDRKAYPFSYNYYDSTDVNLLLIPADKERATLRKPPLKTVKENTEKIIKEDSLQRIANMPEAERELFVKKIAKQLRKQKGLKEENSTGSSVFINPNAPPVDLFSNNSSGDFYFYNTALKSKGFSEFRSRWGKRDNVDNWRRSESIKQLTEKKKSKVDMSLPSMNDVSDIPMSKDVKAEKDAGNATAADDEDISYTGLMSRLPLTAEKLSASNTTLMKALYSNGKTFQNDLEDYPAAIAAFEELLKRFPESDYSEEAMFNLVYLYNKTGNNAKAQQFKQRLNSEYSKSTFTQKVNAGLTDKGNADPATKKYQEVYNLFLEGKFDIARQEKKKADSLYGGGSLWTPQLLFIESIYYIKQQNDSAAIASLNNIVKLHPKSAVAERATTMIDVLRRRKEIETYLTNLQIEKKEDIVTKRPTTNDAQQAVKTIDPPVKIVTAPTVTNIPQPIKIDTEIKKAVSANSFTFNAAEPQSVVLVLDKVDGVFVNEAKNALVRFNREKFYGKEFSYTNVKIDDTYTLMLVNGFANATEAVDYMDKTKPSAASKILPWLTADKYSFIIISAANLEILKNNKDVKGYLQLLQQALPGKF